MSSKKTEVLVVEDEEMLGLGIQSGLEQEAFDVEWVKDGQSALEALAERRFDVVVLDLGLPKLSGLKVLSQMRKDGNATPVLILTARDTIDDLIKGLDAGSDDYMTKPFRLEELSARIRALTRRGASKRQFENLLVYRNIKLDVDAMLVHIDDKVLNLPRREFTLLRKLVEGAGRVMSRDHLQQCLYGWNDEVDSNTIEVHIHNIRKKLPGDFIRTIRGVGYMVEKE